MNVLFLLDSDSAYDRWWNGQLCPCNLAKKDSYKDAERAPRPGNFVLYDTCRIDY